MFCSLNLLFSDVLVAVAVVVFLNSLNTEEKLPCNPHPVISSFPHLVYVKLYELNRKYLASGTILQVVSTGLDPCPHSSQTQRVWRQKLGMWPGTSHEGTSRIYINTMSGCLLESVIVWPQTSIKTAMVNFSWIIQPAEFTGLLQCVGTQKNGQQTWWYLVGSRTISLFPSDTTANWEKNILISIL